MKIEKSSIQESIKGIIWKDFGNGEIPDETAAKVVNKIWPIIEYLMNSKEVNQEQPTEADQLLEKVIDENYNVEIDKISWVLNPVTRDMIESYLDRNKP